MPPVGVYNHLLDYGVWPEELVNREGVDVMRPPLGVGAAPSPAGVLSQRLRLGVSPI
jgi:hypothetical protein